MLQSNGIPQKGATRTLFLKDRPQHTSVRDICGGSRGSAVVWKTNLKAPAYIAEQKQVTGLHGTERLRGFERGSFTYTRALALYRQQQFDDASRAFEMVLQQTPEFAKAWISYAQMEKRRELLSCSTEDATNEASELDKYRRARLVLKRGLCCNPSSALILQAWGLLELQRGNYWAAAKLVDRCVATDPQRCGHLLRWKLIQQAFAKAQARN